MKRKPKDGDPFLFESPARRKLRLTILNIQKLQQVLDTNLQWLPPPRPYPNDIAAHQSCSARFKTEEASVRAFFRDGKQKLGHIVAASGFGRRSSTNGRLDWALIKISEECIPKEKNTVSFSPF